MPKVPLDTIGSGYASTSLLNNNFTDIQNGFENTLSRDGSTPNEMNADLDMNSNDILNAKDISMTGNLTVDGTDYLTSMQTVYNNFATIIQNATISTSPPSGGEDGDIWYQV